MARVRVDDFLWTSTNDEERSEFPWMDKLGLDDWIKIKYGKVDASTKENIWKGCMRKEDPSEEENPNDTSDKIKDDCKAKWGEEKERCKCELVEDLLDDKWFKGTETDDDDIEGIMDYLELQGHDGFTELDDEAYEQRRCKLLGIPYEGPPPIVA